MNFHLHPELKSERALLRPRHYICPKRRRRTTALGGTGTAGQQIEIVFIIEY